MSNNARNILVVEDEPMIAMLFEDFLDMLGHRCFACVDTLDDALKACDTGGFDAAILDVHLGSQLAWPVAERLRTNNTPFVIASGGTSEGFPASLGDVLILAKPFNIQTFEEVISKLF
jgi:DNA-binding response OmpR family regulator